jgi:hypothetical protein
MTSPNWPKQFRAAASTFDWPALAQLAAEYATHLYAVPKLPDSVGQVLLVLRQSRRYEELELVADAALAHGPDAPAVRRHYAQALVDSGNRPSPCASTPSWRPTRRRRGSNVSRPGAASAAATKRCSSRAPSRTDGGAS